MRAGDTVKHLPTGRTWLVACVDEGLVWSAGHVPVWIATSECSLVEAASDAAHEAELRRWAGRSPSDPRQTRCARQLGELLACRDVSSENADTTATIPKRDRFRNNGDIGVWVRFAGNAVSGLVGHGLGSIEDVETNDGVDRVARAAARVADAMTREFRRRRGELARAEAEEKPTEPTALPTPGTGKTR